MIKKILTIFTSLLLFQIARAQPANTNISNGVAFDGEPFLAINPTNNQNLVTAWMGLKFSNGLYRIAIKTRASFDGGNSWTTANSLPHFGAGFGSADVSMAFDKNGLLFLAYIDYKQSPDSGGVYVARSFNGGLNWDTPTKAFDMYDVANKRAIDRPWLVIDRSTTSNSGFLYITTKPAPWIAPPNRNYFKFSTDSGYTWSNIASVDRGTHLVGNLIAAPMAAPITTIGGSFCAIYPSYITAQNPLPAYYFATSKDKGQNFLYTTVYTAIPAANDSNFKNGYQLIAHQSDSNKLIFLTPDAQNGDADIKAFHSNDGGRTWSKPVRINDDALSNGKSQDLVWGAYNELGNVVVTWRDRRNSTSNGFWNAGYNFYYATSIDNGNSFSPNRLLSNQFISFDSVLLQSGNDFMSCVYVSDTLYSAWGDTRNGKMNIYFAKTKISTNTSVGFAIIEGDEPKLKIYPTPPSNNLNVIVSDELIGKMMVIYDGGGKIVLDKIVNERVFVIETRDFCSGIYFIKVENEAIRFIH